VAGGNVPFRQKVQVKRREPDLATWSKSRRETSVSPRMMAFLVG